ncbi:MAG TPA: hypothetical protein VKR59_10865 [Terriglobales bacterium]|nr:hypothetical protein [Terriglobales bacterium]
MFGSEMLDIAIGMIFTYLLLSLICSAINELIERQLKNRATDLEQGIRELLDDKDGTGLVTQLYQHGMISGLFRGNYNANAKDKSNLPSYIPSRNFAIAIMSIVAPKDPAANFQNSIAEIKSDKVRNALSAMFEVGGKDVQKFRDSIENWFNSTMDRVSGWYKRRSQLIIFVLGFGAAAIINVNSITIANDLWIHKAERDAVVSAAQGYLGTHSAKDGQTGQDSSLKANIEAIESYRLPIGWKTLPPKDTLTWLRFGLWSLFGWLITACAVSLGAPFWFDVLNKFIIIRSTVKPHEKSGEEQSKS